MSERISHDGYRAQSLNAPPPATTPSRNSSSRKRKRPWGLIISTGLLTILLLVVAGISVYLYQTAIAWEERSAQLSGRVQDLADEAATVSDDLDVTNQALELTETQLDTARERITELADEKAQLGDEHAVQQRLVEYQEHVSEVAADVLFVLEECISGQDSVIEYLKDQDNYDAEDLSRFEGEVAHYCTDATTASEDLMKELSQ